MTRGRVLRHLFGALGSLDLPPDAERDVIACLRADRRGPLALCLAACRDARLEDEIAMARVAACMLLFAAGNLADDLADGECGYLEVPDRLGPGATVLLLALALREMARGGVSGEVIARIAEHLARTAAAQQVEVRQSRWSLETALEVAEGVAGHQLATYLAICWHGTLFEPLAQWVGLPLGVAVHVVHDLRDEDARVATLSRAERLALVERARAGLRDVEALALRTVRKLVPELDRALARALARDATPPAPAEGPQSARHAPPLRVLRAT